MSGLSIMALQARCKYRLAKYAGSRVSGFAEAKARAEDRRRAANLRRAASGLKGKRAARARELAERLSYGDGPAPATLASSAYYHALRDPLLDNLVRLAAKPKWAPVALAVLLPRNAYVAPGKLKRFAARRFLERLRADLRWARAMSARGWLLASVHGEFNETRDGWNPHYHIVAAGPGMNAALERLRKKRKYKLIPGVPDRIRSSKAPPMRRRVIDPNELRYALSYLLPGFWPNRWQGEGAHDDEARSRRRRLPGEREAEFLLWLDRQQLTDLVLLVHLRVGRKGLRVNPPSKPSTNGGGR